MKFQNPSSVQFVLILGLVLFAVLVLVLGLLYTTTNTYAQKPDVNNSGKRLAQINNVLSSHFGRSWPTLFLIIGIFLIIILVLLVWNSAKPFTLKVSDQAGWNLSIIGLCTLIILAVVVVLVFLNYYLKDPNDQSDTIASRKKFLSTVGTVLAVIFIGTLAYSFLSR